MAKKIMSNTELSIKAVSESNYFDKLIAEVRINTDSPSSINAIDLTFDYDAGQLIPLKELARPGELASEWSDPVHNIQNGQILTSQSSAKGLKGSEGSILSLAFKLKNKNNGSAAIRLNKANSQIQEGKISYTAKKYQVVY